MAFLQVNFHSDVLGQAMSMNVILPQKVNTQIGMASSDGDECKCLYLLHGMSDDHTIWQRRTSIERYVADKNIAVIMPCAHLSWYTDMKYGGAYQTFIFDELPAIVHGMFKQISSKREDNFVAGLSMGGYGALKMALTNPDKFCACAAFSGAFDVCARIKDNPENTYWRSIFGSVEETKGSKNDVYSLIEKCAKQNSPLPRIYMWCGTEDSLLGENRRAKELLEANGYDIEYSESSGNHSWFYWDREIQNALKFFFQ